MTGPDERRDLLRRALEKSGWRRAEKPNGGGPPAWWHTENPAGAPLVEPDNVTVADRHERGRSRICIDDRVWRGLCYWRVMP